MGAGQIKRRIQVMVLAQLEGVLFRGVTLNPEPCNTKWVSRVPGFKVQYSDFWRRSPKTLNSINPKH